MVKLSLATRGRAGAHPSPLPPDALADPEREGTSPGPRGRLPAELSPETRASRFLIRAHFCSTLELMGREVKDGGQELKFTFLLQNTSEVGGSPRRCKASCDIYSLLSRWRPPWTRISSRGGSALLSPLQAGQRREAEGGQALEGLRSLDTHGDGPLSMWVLMPCDHSGTAVPPSPSFRD